MAPKQNEYLLTLTLRKDGHIVTHQFLSPADSWALDTLFRTVREMNGSDSLTEGELSGAALQRQNEAGSWITTATLMFGQKK